MEAQKQNLTETLSTNKATDVQVGGNHYKDMAIQPITFVLANNLGFCEGNVIKYVSRWGAKNGIEDLKKARHYLDLLIEKVEAECK
tara:strand:+ start:1696 stop:1953 length:258 start_codon:yes stop_codon:yes gene_type:complete